MVIRGRRGEGEGGEGRVGVVGGGGGALLMCTFWFQGLFYGCWCLV